ncbi:MAG: DUF4419 domain-containing protein [Fluviicola sp.]
MKRLLLLFFIGTFSASAQISDGVTFTVDAVQQNTDPLQTASLDTILHNKFQKKIIAIPAASQGKKIAPAMWNGLVETVHTAFDEHRPLVLSPDDIWLTICQAFGNHIAVTSEEMKESMVVAGAPEEIRVFIRDLAEDDPKDWEAMVDVFNDSLRLYLKNDPVALVNQKFSTTTPVITTAYQITLMDAVKTYFSFAMESGCGIPSITLLGTPEDWQKIYDQLDGFNAYGMEFWTKELKPVIQEFIGASKGQEHREFWQSIYKHETFYGKTAVTGWIHKFFPYLRKRENMEKDVMEYRELEYKNTYVRNPYITGKDYLLSDIGTGDFPKGYVSVPFIWDEQHPSTGLVTQHKLKIHAGFFGVEQNEDLSLRPNISWCVVEESNKSLEYIKWWEWREPDAKKESQRFYWKLGVIDTSRAIALPIFDPENNSDYESGVASLQQLLKEKGFSSQEASTLQIISTIDGGTIFRSIEGPLASKEEEIKMIIENSDWLWKPAMGKIFLMDSDVNSADANCLIELKL